MNYYIAAVPEVIIIADNNSKRGSTRAKVDKADSREDTKRQKNNQLIVTPISESVTQKATRDSKKRPLDTGLVTPAAGSLPLDQSGLFASLQKSLSLQMDHAFTNMHAKLETNTSSSKQDGSGGPWVSLIHDVLTTNGQTVAMLQKVLESNGENRGSMEMIVDKVMVSHKDTLEAVLDKVNTSNGENMSTMKSLVDQVMVSNVENRGSMEMIVDKVMVSHKDTLEAVLDKVNKSNDTNNDRVDKLIKDVFTDNEGSRKTYETMFKTAFEVQKDSFATLFDKSATKSAELFTKVMDMQQKNQDMLDKHANKLIEGTFAGQKMAYQTQVQLKLAEACSNQTSSSSSSSSSSSNFQDLMVSFGKNVESVKKVTHDMFTSLDDNDPK